MTDIAATDTVAPYRDATRPVEERVADLLGRMTVEEKAGQLTQYFYLAVAANLPPDFDPESLPPEQRAFLNQTAMVDGAIAAGTAGSTLFVKDPATSNRLQRIAVEDSRLGIPLLLGFDVIHGFRTIFPVPIAIAASWDASLAEAAQRVAAREARAAGIHWAFAPMLDIARDPRWGRIVESPGEDPTLGAAMGAAQVRGFQGDLGPESILAGPKHFLGYGASRGGRDYEDAEISESELWNVYLPPFRAAVDAGAANIMSAYMDLNGVPASGNRKLLTTMLRDGLGFDGFTVSDANAVRSLETQHFARDLGNAAVRALNAGLDMEMAMMDPAYTRLPQAVGDGTIDEAVLDAAVIRVLTAKFALGLFENPYADESTTDAVLNDPRHRELARSAAERSFVLLKNADDALPLDPTRLASIAVIGQLADSPRDTLGPWVFDHDTSEAVTLVQGLRSRLGEAVQVEHAIGVMAYERIVPSPFDGMDRTVPRRPVDYDDDDAMSDAVALATDADVAIVVVGQPQNQIGEAASVSTLDLPGRQQEQLERIVATGTPVIVVVMAGRPLDVRWADANVPAILMAWYPGTRGGDALAAALVGDVSPAGRLPFTWPRHVGQVPKIAGHYRTFQPERDGRRYFDEEDTPLYEFGHGLSYARFDYTDLRAADSTMPIGASTTISVSVTNTSRRSADEVVALYVHQRWGSSSRPVRELKAFTRIRLDALESRTVTFALGPDQLSYWSDATQGFVQDATTIDVWVGPTGTTDPIELRIE